MLARNQIDVIQRELLDPLALDILDGKFHEGDTVSVDARAGKLMFS